MDALHELLTTARQRRWCVRPYCTTCGAREYRQAIHANPVPLAEALRTARLRELRREFAGIDFDDALRLLFMELTNPFGPLVGNMRVIEEGLVGTEAGDYLADMRQHEQRLAVERAQRAAYRSPEAVAERRRAKAEQRLAAQAARVAEKRMRDADADAAVHAFAGLLPAEALRRIMQGSVGFPLYRLPAESIEEMIGALGALTDEELGLLREQVPTTRAAPLARLSRGIAAELKSRSDASLRAY